MEAESDRSDQSQLPLHTARSLGIRALCFRLPVLQSRNSRNADPQVRRRLRGFAGGKHLQRKPTVITQHKLRACAGSLPVRHCMWGRGSPGIITGSCGPSGKWSLSLCLGSHCEQQRTWGTPGSCWWKRGCAEHGGMDHGTPRATGTHKARLELSCPGFHLRR